MNSNDNWKDIDGYEGIYQVNDLGQVKSLDRIAIKAEGAEHRIKGRMLKPIAINYRKVKYRLWKDNEVKQVTFENKIYGNN